MQTLESTPIIAPEGYFVYDIRLTEAGRAKVEQAWEHWNNTTWEFIGHKWENCVYDIECDAISMECEPACKIGNEVINFVRDIDFVVEMRSFEAANLERLAKELNELHSILEQELNRLGA